MSFLQSFVFCSLFNRPLVGDDPNLLFVGVFLLRVCLVTFSLFNMLIWKPYFSLLSHFSAISHKLSWKIFEKAPFLLYPTISAFTATNRAWIKILALFKHQKLFIQSPYVWIGVLLVGCRQVFVRIFLPIPSHLLSVLLQVKKNFPVVF